jgi:hypothetical protein
MASLFTATNIRRTASSLRASINRYERERNKQLAYESAQREYYRIQAESEVFTTIHDDLAPLRSIEEANRQLEKLVIDTYDRASFDVPKPTLDESRSRVAKEARKQYRTFLFWSDKEKCNEYITAHLSERHAEFTKLWEQEKAEFEKAEDVKEQSFKDKAQAEYDAKKKEIDAFLTPSNNVILNEADKLLAELELPFDVSTTFDFDSEKGQLIFDIEFPDESIIPQEKASILKSGRLSVSNKTKKELHYDYVLAVCGVSYKIASLAFNISARVKAVAIYGHILRIDDKTATLKDDYLYAVIFDRETYSNVVSSGEFIPHQKFVFFPHKISLTSQYVFKSIDPKNLDDSLVDSTIQKFARSLGEIKFTITSNIPNSKSNPNRAFSPDDGSGFDYLGYHDWKEVDSSEITLSDSSSFPDWEHMYVYSKSDINKADLQIQSSYLQIRRDFFNGVYYDLSSPGKTNYGFVLFFDLFSAYAMGKSDIKKLCKELDVLTIVCGKTERYIKRTFNNCFEEVTKPQEDKDFASAYFNL